MVKLAHISDPHVPPLPAARWGELIGKRLTGYINWQRSRRRIHDAATLAGIVAAVKAQAADHVVVSGDIANIALPAEYPRGRVWLDSLGTTDRISFVPGNHDIYVGGAERLVAQHWAPFMSSDGGAAGFPFVRRRGPLALIGLNSGVATAPFFATGRIGADQLAALSSALARLKAEGLFRVVVIHHPPVSNAGRHKRLTDAKDLLTVIASHGAELLIHGHDHRNMINLLAGPDGTHVPAVGVASASAAPGTTHDAASFNLYRIDGAPGQWRCVLETYAMRTDGRIARAARAALHGAPVAPDAGDITNAE